MNRISLCVAYYENSSMLARQYQEWAGYPKGLKQYVEMIVVDDGSPENRAADVPRPKGLPPLKLFRMVEDLRWNQDACRNLAADHATGDWLLLTDMDHIVPAATMAHVVEKDLKSGVVYRFARVSAPDLLPYKVHPNTWLVERALFEDIGGYDEAYCGYYGTDFDIRDRLLARASLEMIDEPVIRMPREVIADASTTTLERKRPEDSATIRAIRAKIQLVPNYRPARRGAPWERMA